MKKEQERTIEELKDHQELESERMAEKLEKESKDEEARKLKAFEAYRLRAINEVRNRQAAELSSRNDMDTDESQRVGFLVTDCSCTVDELYLLLITLRHISLRSTLRDLQGDQAIKSS